MFFFIYQSLKCLVPPSSFTSKMNYFLIFFGKLYFKVWFRQWKNSDRLASFDKSHIRIIFNNSLEETFLELCKSVLVSLKKKKMVRTGACVLFLREFSVSLTIKPRSPPLPCDLRLNSLQVSVNSLDYFFMFFNTRDQRLSVETTDEEQKDACQAWGLLTVMSLRSPEPRLDPLGLCFCKACL